MRISLLTYVSVSLYSCADLVSGFQSGFSPLTSPLLKTRRDGFPQFISTCNPHLLARKDTYLKSSEKNQPPESSEGNVDDLFDAKTTLFLVGGQSLLIPIAAVFATIFNVPNYGACVLHLIWLLMVLFDSSKIGFFQALDHKLSSVLLPSSRVF
jgi:hypothetical protein